MRTFYVTFYIDVYLTFYVDVYPIRETFISNVLFQGRLSRLSPARACSSLMPPLPAKLSLSSLSAIGRATPLDPISRIGPRALAVLPPKSQLRPNRSPTMFIAGPAHGISTTPASCCSMLTPTYDSPFRLRVPFDRWGLFGRRVVHERPPAERFSLGMSRPWP